MATNSICHAEHSTKCNSALGFDTIQHCDIIIVMAEFKNKFASRRQDWETPSEIFDPLNVEFGFTLDVCATIENRKCDNFYSISDNGLAKEWHGTCWMNPPFGTQGKWVKKAYESAQHGATVVCLLPSRTNTNWWHDYCMNGEVRFIRGRPKFKGAEHGLPQPLAIIIFKPLTICAKPSSSYIHISNNGASSKKHKYSNSMMTPLFIS